MVNGRNRSSGIFRHIDTGDVAIRIGIHVLLSAILLFFWDHG